MPVAKVVTAQRDFSAGELDIAVKRADDNPAMKAGARQMRNWRILNSKGLNNRSGRRALFLDGPRVDEVLMSPGNTFYLVFGNGYLRVYNGVGSKVFDSATTTVSTPWTAATAASVVWDIYRLTIYITFGDAFPANVPIVLSWDGVSQISTWTLVNYAEDQQSSGQKRTIFCRLSPLGITCQPSAPVGGSVNGLPITNAGQFTQVPTVTIGPPGPGGTTATAVATLELQNIAVVNAGFFISSPLGAFITLPNGVLLQIYAVGPASSGYPIVSLGVLNFGSISSGSIPSNPVTALSVSFGHAAVLPTFNINWQLAPLTLTNGGGSGYVTNPAVTLSPTGNAVVNATISSGSGASNTTIQFSAGMQLNNSYIGTRIRFCNRQILITGVTSPTVATGVVEEVLYPSSVFSTTSNANMNLYFSVGAEVIGQLSGAKAVVASISSSGLQITLQYIGATTFTIPEIFVSTGNSLKIDNAVSTNQAPAAVTVWDDEVMNKFRGYPRACFVDQGRLGLNDFPALPGLIAWSAQGDFTDQYTDANNAAPTNAIQELAPGKSRVMYVVPGPEGSEFVMCDNAAYYIPINQTTPLQPGSVAFNTLTVEGCAQVKPQLAEQSVVYVSVGSQKLKVIQPIGAYSRPYIVDDLTELHSHLLNSPISISIPGGSNQFEERYIYLVNSDGSMAVGKYGIKGGLVDTEKVGWLPWSGNGTAAWCSARPGSPNLLIAGSYAPNGVTAVTLVEQLDDTQYLDASVLYNSVPSGIPTPGGKGPLWWLANGAVDLMDAGRMMGTYQIDGNGFLIPQNNAGENFESATLTCGQAWTATFEPFVPAVSPGQDVNQRLRKRRIQRHEVYVQNSSGFVMARLFGGPVTRASPAPGTIMKERRFPAWNQDDDPTQPPPLREQSYSDRPTGRVHDPRVAIIKDTPGPLSLLEVDLEVSV